MIDKDIVIVGAGISGLSLSYFLKQAKSTVSLALLEKSARCGGNIATHTIENCLLDQGPDSFITAKPHALSLCKDLGLEADLIPFSKKASPLWLVRKGVLRALPQGLYLGLPKNALAFLGCAALPMRMKVRMALDFFSRKQNRQEDISLGDFLRQHFGAESIDYLFNPILGGIFAASVDDLSLQATFPQFLDLEKNFGSLIRGLKQKGKTPAPHPPFLSLKQGMGSLIKALEGRLSPDELYLNHGVSEIGFAENKFHITTTKKTTFSCSKVVVATPAQNASVLLRKFSTIANEMKEFTASSTAVTFLAFEAKTIPPWVKGLGFLTPKTENLNILAGTFVSNKFEGRSPADIFLMRTFFGGLNRESVLEASDDALGHTATTEVGRLLNVNLQPIFTKTFRYEKQSPVYGVGHLDRIARLHRALATQPGVHYLNNALDGVGIPDCIRRAKDLADQLLKT